MSASAGRVLLIFKGDYESATTYKPLDVVVYGVNSYVCLLESTGNVPTNTTYWQTLAKGISNMSPEAIGIGYGLSQNTGASKTATLTDYTLTINGIVAVTFADDVPANATLNINSQGAKAIYYRGSALVANVIRGGDTVTFAYDGTRYNVLCIDGGAGHEIENSAGTKLTQRDVMQVTDGLEAVDDSTNQKTKIKMNLPIVSFEDWNAMTEQEQEAYKASHYRFGVEQPDTSGVINAEYMTLLWENPNTTQSFASQTITLSSADYDFLLIECSVATSADWRESFIASKSANTIFASFTIGLNPGTAQIGAYIRKFTKVSDTSISVDNATKNWYGSINAIDNTLCIPIAVYGIKKDFQFKVNAIATELSTRADHCFLSDGETSVEDTLNYSTEEQYGGKWIDGSNWYYKTVVLGALPNATAKNVPHGISNLNKVIKISGTMQSGTTAYPLPMVDNSNMAAQVTVLVLGDNVRIACGSDRSSYNGYVILRYTKTS
jgi:hypothetical protein